jgi:hypothetical protein
MNSFRKFLIPIFIFLMMMFLTCQSNPDYNKLKSEILALHKATIDAHWKKDIGFFTKDLADDFFPVGNGEIRKPTKAEINAQFTSYLNNMKFTEYRDLQEPIIGFSKDGSTAWSIVQVKVAGKRSIENGGTRDVDFICAWITLYQRQGDSWLRLGEVSNFKTDE